jgi:predicted nucleic acid-binding protein
MLHVSDRLVIDTDVASFLFNQDPARAPRYQAITNGRTLYLPFVSVSEMLFGAEIRGWGPARRARLQGFFQRYSIVQSDPRVCLTWATIRAGAQRNGRTIERQDAWVAAVAVTLNLPLVTHNASHFNQVPFLQVVTSPDP